jgi:hypothetical protein
MRRSVFVLAVVILSLAATNRIVCAQSASAARLVSFNAKPGSRVQLETAIKQQMDARREQKDPWRWLTWEYLSGEVPRYCVATFGHEWAEFDRAPADGRAEESGGAAAAALSSEPPRVQYFEHLEEVSDFGTQTDTPTMAEISLFQLHYGRKAQFCAALREFHEALSRAGSGQRYEWFELRSGGDTPQFMLLVPRVNWEAFDLRADLLQECLEKAMGKRKANKVFEQFTAAVKSHQRSAVRLRPDLSLLPSSGDSRP